MCYINYFTVLFAPHQPQSPSVYSCLQRSTQCTPSLLGTGWYCSNRSCSPPFCRKPADYISGRGQGDSLYSHSTHSPGRCSSGLVSAACGTDAENTHLRLLGQMYLGTMLRILGALLGLEKLIPETVSAPLQLSTPDPCLTNSLTPPLSSIYSKGTGTEAFLSLLALPLQ